MKDIEARGRLDFQWGNIKELSKRIVDLEYRPMDRRVEVKFNTDGRPDTSGEFCKSMSIADALQHLIDCLDITYSPDKFNHD